MPAPAVPAHATVPSGSDPRAVLDRAGEDASAGRFAEALAGFVWFHEHAVGIDPAWTGVRRSFALGDWHDLALKYPPALDAMRAARDAAEVRFDAAGEASAFRDLAALNEHLGEPDRAVRRFLRTAAADPAGAARLYRTAEPLLIAAGESAACGPFVDAADALSDAADLYFRMSADERRPGPPPCARDFYVRRATVPIALLARNGRPAEARAAHAAAAAFVDRHFLDPPVPHPDLVGPEFASLREPTVEAARTRLAAALRGVFDSR